LGPISTPLWDFYPPHDQSGDRIGLQSVRLPNSPDFLSLPAAVSISSFGCGSSFQVRYVSGGLLFLKPLGTSYTMRPQTYSVNQFLNCFVRFSSDYFSFVSRGLQTRNTEFAVHKTESKKLV